MKINILGSCVSRVSLLKGERGRHGIYGDGDLELGYFLDKHNIVLAMMPAPFSREEVMEITADELWDKSRIHSLHQLLMKDTVSLLLESDAEYIVMDLYDFHNSFFVYENKAFSTQANEFTFTRLFKKYQDKIQGIVNLFALPEWIVYPYIDLFFEKIMQKYDSDHIILNRFRANDFFWGTDGDIYEVPEECKMHFQCNSKYNKQCRKVEDYIIQKINPYVIDLSKFFMGDQQLWPDNLNAAHFEKEFYRETYDQIVKIVTGQTTERYFDKPRFFDKTREGYEEDNTRPIKVGDFLLLFEAYLEQGNLLWMNILDKLYAYAPENETVQQYMEVLRQEGVLG